MCLRNLFLIYALVFVNDVKSTNIKLYRNSEVGDELLSQPIELVEEHQYPDETSAKQLYKTDGGLDSQFRGVKKEKHANNVVDAGGLPRKVWSRWSKWGECSVTCGRGAKMRRRLCLSGRCAPGEREEQRLPCCSRPCQLN